MKKHRDYVYCDRCHARGPRLKPDIDRLPPIVGVVRYDEYGISGFVRNFISGLWHRIPICCVLYFCVESYKGNQSIAKSSAMKRFGVWPEPKGWYDSVCKHQTTKR